MDKTARIWDAASAKEIAALRGHDDSVSSSSAAFSPDGSRIVTASDDRTARMTGHRSLEMLKTYSRNAEAFVGHAGAGLL